MNPAQIAQAVLNLQPSLIEKTAHRLAVLVEMHFANGERYVDIHPKIVWSIYLQTLKEVELPEAFLLQYVLEEDGGVYAILHAIEEALGKSYSVRKEEDTSLAICRLA